MEQDRQGGAGHIHVTANAQAIELRDEVGAIEQARNEPRQAAGAPGHQAQTDGQQRRTTRQEQQLRTPHTGTTPGQQAASTNSATTEEMVHLPQLRRSQHQRVQSSSGNGRSPSSTSAGGTAHYQQRTQTTSSVSSQRAQPKLKRENVRTLRQAQPHGSRVLEEEPTPQASLGSREGRRRTATAATATVSSARQQYHPHGSAQSRRPSHLHHPARISQLL